PNGHEAAPHSASRFASRATANEYDAAGHPPPFARERGGEEVAGAALNRNGAAAQRGGGPIARIPFDRNLATAHRFAQMAANRSGNVQQTAGHARPRAMDGVQISLQTERIGGVVVL